MSVCSGDNKGYYCPCPRADWKPKSLINILSWAECIWTTPETGLSRDSWSLVFTWLENMDMILSLPSQTQSTVTKLIELQRDILANFWFRFIKWFWQFFCLFKISGMSDGSQDQILDKSIVINVNTEINIQIGSYFSREEKILLRASTPSPTFVQSPTGGFVRWFFSQIYRKFKNFD